MAFSTIGIILSIILLFVNIDLAVRTAAALLVGIVGIISFVRHSVYYHSDQVRMGWHQDHPEFHLEVGYANLAVGIWALVAAVFDWGFVCGVAIAIYATYLFCVLLLHIVEAISWEDLHIAAHRSRVIRSIISTGFSMVMLVVFAVVAFARAGMVPFMQL